MGQPSGTIPIFPPQAEALFARFAVTEAGQRGLEKWWNALRCWSLRHNLIGRRELTRLWTHHIEQSLLLLSHFPPGTNTVLDIGSGCGIPAVPIAASLANRQHSGSARQVICVERSQKKASFLRYVAGSTALPLAVMNQTCESLTPETAAADVITARAVASVSQLLHMSAHLFQANTVALWLKGARAQAEVRQALDNNVSVGGRAFQVTVLPLSADSETRVVKARLVV